MLNYIRDRNESAYCRRGGREKSLLSEPGSELRVGRVKTEKERCEDNRWDE